MGSSESDPEPELSYLLTLSHPALGPCEIYSSTRTPHCYIMRVTTGAQSPALLQLMSQIENSQNLYLLGLYGYRIAKQCECVPGQMVSQLVVSYWEYLGYTLGDLLQHRRARGLRLVEG